MSRLDCGCTVPVALMSSVAKPPLILHHSSGTAYLWLEAREGLGLLVSGDITNNPHVVRIAIGGRWGYGGWHIAEGAQP